MITRTKLLYELSTGLAAADLDVLDQVSESSFVHYFCYANVYFSFFSLFAFVFNGVSGVCVSACLFIGCGLWCGYGAT